MLDLINLKKSYKMKEYETKALDGVTVSFRDREFVSILGPSGSGKTTCLNVIGGLDRYDSGDLIIKGKSTKHFKDKEWDAYRNNSVGFVFQSYNLISHLTVLSNVELAMTLSGVKRKEKKKRAIEALDQVGLKEHMNKRPNQLSGGQMQRVAIARALVNKPEILLCDEPTGALDTITSIQIMELIKEISKDRLVIMVTHNPEIAKKYSDRIINFEDGKIIADSKPYDNKEENKEFKLNKTSMNFFTALHLSFNNIRTKKGRTFLTAFASSIGIIGIAVILSLSTGFQNKIDEYIKDTMDQFPIIINTSVAEVDEETLKSTTEEMKEIMQGTAQYPTTDEIYLYDSSLSTLEHKNNITTKYTEYLEKINKEICNSIGYIDIAQMNVLRKVDDEVKPIHFSSGINQETQYSTSGMTNMSVTTYPTMLEENKTYLEEYYDLLSGEYPKESTDLVLVVDSKNRVDIETMKNLGYDTEDLDSIKFEDIVGIKMKLISNDNYYNKTPFEIYVPGTKYEDMYDEDDNVTLKIVGIVRSKSNVKISLLAGGIAYSNDLNDLVVGNAKDSKIVKDQKKANYNIFTREKLKDEDAKNQMISYLGGSDAPLAAIIYPKDFNSKDAVINYLDEYNKNKEDEKKIIYTDLSETITSMTRSIMDSITVVLIAFAAISLIVSLIMICIITYTSVLERTKEIGILKALGARRKDITRVFNAETFILGIFSGTLGVAISYFLTFPINDIIYKLSDLENVAYLPITYAVSLVIISTIITVIGGWIPAKMAAKKEATIALRTE